MFFSLQAQKMLWAKEEEQVFIAEQRDALDEDLIPTHQASNRKRSQTEGVAWSRLGFELPMTAAPSSTV